MRPLKTTRMKQLLAAIFLFALTPLFSQKSYFQQEAHYTISVTLDDRAHTLAGDLAFEYVNHSPDALSEIWLHCWPNAYASRRSAFNRQKLAQDDTEFHFAPDSARGGLERLDFTADGQKAAWQFDRDNPDIAMLTLPKPLPPGGRVRIATPFLLKIPASFSRLGHVGQSYQLTQWFPKPAVYDARGWHPMPYLDQGEFYSEFGSFDVTITLPDNYVVGATGVLQTASEWQFLQEKEAATREKIKRPAAGPAGKSAKSAEAPFPPSSAAMKTLRFTADSVHDFAWFADKRFHVLRDTARLASGRTVDCWVMFTDENFRPWQKGAFYVRRSVEFYSELVGEYPWPQATAVHSALSAGGGMEYPMITVIGNTSDPGSLDEVITHEVGHNWFYGILASNERDHPWLDEGLNTYYELRYMKKYYGNSIADNALPKQFYDPKVYGPPLYTAYLMLARNHRDVPPDSRSDRFTALGYGLQAYMKPALCMAWLEKSAGTAAFDRAMQAYYRDWRFRHPGPGDLRESWRAAGLEADWFFQAMQTRRKTDYALKKVEKTAGGYRLTIRNRGALNAPFPVTALRDGQPIGTQWYPAPAASTEKVVFAVENADDFAIDGDFATLDLSQQNNRRRTPFGLRGLAPLENPRRRILGLLPWMGWNNYDKFMLGLAAYNPPFPGRRFQYYVAPAFGFGSKELNGLVDLRYRFYPGGFVQKVTVGASAKTFNGDFRQGEYWRYYRLVPSVRAELRSRSLTYRHWLNFRTLFIGRERTPSGGIFSDEDFLNAMIHEARYEAVQKRLPFPYSLTVVSEWQTRPSSVLAPGVNYWRTSVEWKQLFYYREKKKITARVFAGGFLHHLARNNSTPAAEAFALNPQGFNDYRFDQVFLGRSEDEGIFSQQVGRTDGGFKNAFGAPFAGYTNSNSFLAALNLRADLPFRLPLGLPVKPYFDLGYVGDASPLGESRPLDEQLLWSGGLLLDFFGGSFEVYFPLANAKPLQDLYKERGGYGARISWSWRLHEVEPRRIMDGLLR